MSWRLSSISLSIRSSRFLLHMGPSPAAVRPEGSREGGRAVCMRGCLLALGLGWGGVVGAVLGEAWGGKGRGRATLGIVCLVNKFLLSACSVQVVF